MRPLWCLLSGLSVSVEGVSANGYEGDGDYIKSVPLIRSRLKGSDSAQASAVRARRARETAMLVVCPAKSRATCAAQPEGREKMFCGCLHVRIDA